MHFFKAVKVGILGFTYLINQMGAEDVSFSVFIIEYI